MPYYRQLGEIPAKRHQAFRTPAGGLYAEELMGNDGFAGESALLYHRHGPTEIVNARETFLDDRTLTPNVPLLPRHLRGAKLRGQGGDAVTNRAVLLGNEDVTLAYASASRPSPLYRNAIGDECVYVVAGNGDLETVFGTLRVAAGDYVIIPTSTTHRWLPKETLELYFIESRGHIGVPRRYLTPRGQHLESAPFSERDLHGPNAPLLKDGEDVDVIVRHSGAVTTYTYAHHPFDVVGWDGCLYPYIFNIADFEPIVKRFHAPPPVHQTFEGPNFVVCSFAPRPFDFDETAVPVPYNHANVDSDEVLLYVEGNFMSRSGSGIEAGSLSLHPSGFIHGPQPGSVEAALGQPGTEELAVMVDTFRPLSLGTTAALIEDSGYPWTWARRHQE